MKNIICNLCAGSPDCDLYSINLPEGKQIKVDACIGREVEDLIRCGVLTKGCCCGHGERSPNCLVDIKSQNKLDNLKYEYERYYLKNGIKTKLLMVKLKTNI